MAMESEFWVTQRELWCEGQLRVRLSMDLYILVVQNPLKALLEALLRNDEGTCDP